jgi:3-hydroxyisobutyrate dehydrogenase-like beta-hydroxyacid dehydrogenase
MSATDGTVSVALIGLGEVGRVFAEDLGTAEPAQPERLRITAWDIAFADPGSPAACNAALLSDAVVVSPSAVDAVAGAALVVSAVTAANCVEAARAAAYGITPGTWFFDLNSSSPAHKQAAAQVIEAAGGYYVEAALMSPIGPRRLASPFLLGGPRADGFAQAAPSFGIRSATPVSDDIGRAAATKLCRSVVVKGLEAILTESLLAARVYGVERDVLDSLPNILPPADWEAVAGYFISRSLQHGKRRSEEMAEAAATVADAGIEPLMATATSTRQAWAARFGSAADQNDTLGMVDAVLERLRTESQESRS